MDGKGLLQPWSIHQNPVVAGFVHEGRDWVYSSARRYEKNDGLIKLTELDE